MRTDTYTKIMLTVIAACLLWLSVGGSSRFTALHAATTDIRYVVIAGWSDASNHVHPLAEAQLQRAMPLPVAAR